MTSTVRLAPKPPGSFDPYRLCINYIYLNSIWKKAVGQLRNMEEVIQALAGNQVYSAVDGFSGYFSILMKDSSVLLNTFIVLELSHGRSWLLAYRVLPALT